MTDFIHNDPCFARYPGLFMLGQTLENVVDRERLLNEARSVLQELAHALRSVAELAEVEPDPPTDELGTDFDEQGLIDNLPAKLRELSCQAGEPWTGNDPASDHGHTSCYFNHLAANEIERLRALSGDSTPSGSALIAAERQRQIDVEGWTPDHDESALRLSYAAESYVVAGRLAEMANWLEANEPTWVRSEDQSFEVPGTWPWDASWWKPSADPIRNLVKAGALIAAEIDRLQRAALSGDTEPEQ